MEQDQGRLAQAENAVELEQHRELQVLDILESEPEISQADLAARAGVAVGTVNWSKPAAGATTSSAGQKKDTSK